MKDEDIANALSQRFLTMTGAPDLVFEDQRDNPAPPYVTFEFVPVARADPSLRGGSAMPQGFAQFLIATRPNELAVNARQIADKILAHFPARLALTITGGKILIGDSITRRGYPSGSTFLTSVQVNYTAIKA